MAKKKSEINNLDDIFDGFEKEIINTESDAESESELDTESESESDIELDDEFVKEEEDDFEIRFKSIQNKHKSEGKHSLNRDTIFNGKLEEKVEDEQYLTDVDYYDVNPAKIEQGTQFEFESKFNEDYINLKELEKDVYDLLSENTKLDFTANRRKPNRQTFNSYYQMLLNELKYKYTKSEIFVTLSFYFTDNIFNMFKLLDKKHATIIIIELKNKGYLEDIIGDFDFQ